MTRRGSLSALIALAIFVLALALRLWHIAQTNLWIDEVGSLMLARMPLASLMRDIRQSPHGPLYYLLLKPWIGAFGSSAAALRALSAVAGALAVPIVYAITRRCASGRATALLAALFAALSPAMLYFSQEARFNMLAATLGALALLGYLALRETPARALRLLPLVGFVAPMALAIYAYPAAGLLDVALAGDALLLGLDDPDDRRGALLRRLVIPQLVLAAACIPFVLGRDVGAAMGSQEWRRTIGANAATRDFLGFWSDQFRGRFVHADELATAWDAFWHAWSWTDVAGRLGRALLRISLAPLAVLVCAAAALPGAWRTPRRAVWLAVLVPLVIEAMISSRESLELTRYAIFVAPPLFVLVALGVARLPRVIGAAALALLLLATELGIREYEQIGSRDTDYRTVAALFAREAHPGDSVVVAPWYLAPTLSYYAPALDFVTGERHRGGWGKAAFPGRGEATAERWMIVDYRAGDFYHASGDSIATSAPFIGAHVRVVLDTIVPTGIRVLRFLPDDAPPSGRE